MVRTTQRPVRHATSRIIGAMFGLLDRRAMEAPSASVPTPTPLAIGTQLSILATGGHARPVRPTRRCRCDAAWLQAYWQAGLVGHLAIPLSV